MNFIGSTLVLLVAALVVMLMLLPIFVSLSKAKWFQKHIKRPKHPLDMEPPMEPIYVFAVFQLTGFAIWLIAVIVFVKPS